MTRKFFFALVLLSVIGLLWVKILPAPTIIIFLAELASYASQGPLLAPHTPLGGFASTPFLQEGWGALTTEDFRSADAISPGHQGALIRFYLTQQVALTVDLEGRDLVGPSRVIVSLLPNSSAGLVRKLADLQLQPRWTHHVLQIPSQELREGINQIAISASRPTQWRQCAVQVQNCNPETAPQSIGQDRVRLGFGHSLEFPLLVKPASQFVFDDVGPSIEPGAPSFDSDWDLAIRVQSGGVEPPLDHTWHFRKGGAHKFDFPINHATQVTLSLVATCSTKPLAGQTGLQLKKPRIESFGEQFLQNQPGPALAVPESFSERTKSNILLYVVDTLRADHLHCYGSFRSKTPNFDGLSKDGVLFANCTAQSSWTKPSMASIMTSLLPNDHGAQDFPDLLAPSLPSLAQELARGGYDCRGLVANPFVSKSFGFAAGFSIYEELFESNAHVLTVAASSWLAKRSSRKPFFLYVHALDPHLPYSPPAKFCPPGSPTTFGVQDQKALREEWVCRKDDVGLRRRADRAMALYDGEISSCDEAFGDLMKCLKARHLYDNTLIILVSDHGEQFFEHDLCDHMNSLYQELLHVPLIIKFPQGEGAGTVIKSSWEHIDIAPTILRRADLEIPQTMQGTAYFPGGPDVRSDRPIYFSLHVGSLAARFHQGEGVARADMDGVRLGPWILNRIESTIADVAPVQLFQIEADPGQQHDVAFTRPEVRTWLQGFLKLQSRRQARAGPAVTREVLFKSLRALQYLQ